MADDKFLPEVTVTDNPYGRLSFGPVAPEGKDDNSSLTIALKGGHYRHYNQNGRQVEYVPGASHEICGITDVVDEKDNSSSEFVSKSITAENGDIVINAEDGNIKLLAKNIYIETNGSESDGSFMVKSNDHITMVSGEQMTLAAPKVCVTSSDSLTLNSKGDIFLLCSDIHKKSPLNSIVELLTMGPSSALLKSFVEGIMQTCK